MAEDGSVDRDAWATLVAELVARETKGKKLPFARKVGVDPRTVDRWLKGDVLVKEESVRAIARTFDLQPVDLLVQVGYYTATELAPPAEPDPYQDPIIKEILGDPRWTKEEREDLVARQLERIDADRKRRWDEYEQLVRLRRNRDAS